MNDQNIIKPEDYVEPRCLLCDDPYGKEPQVKPVPQRRIIEKLDEYMSRRDYEGAERHLKYWLEEALLGEDKRGQLVIRNELVGHFRKTGNEKEALLNIKEALKLLQELDFEGTISAGTTYVNAATAYNAFGHNEISMELFEKARSVYESQTGVRPELLGGLYNNMALVCVSTGMYRKASDLYARALEQMKLVSGGELEQAVTYLNMADALENEQGPEQAQEQIDVMLEKAYAMLDTSAAPRDGYYAFVCEKCAPVFEYYGYFIQAGELKERAENIYERD